MAPNGSDMAPSSRGHRSGDERQREVRPARSAPCCPPYSRSCSFGNLFSMAELELKRTDDDRRLYALESVGTLRLEGLGGRMATAEAGAESWHITRRGSGGGPFRPRTRRTPWSASSSRAACAVGRASLGGRELELRPASCWRERRPRRRRARACRVRGRGWAPPVGAWPTRVRWSWLVLFAAFVVRGLAEDAGAAAGGRPPALTDRHSSAKRSKTTRRREPLRLDRRSRAIQTLTMG